MWLIDGQLRALGFAAVGSDVLIDQSVLIHGAEHIRIGSHVRIDAFSDLSAGPGELIIGDHVHLAAAVHVFAAAGVTIAPFAGLSSRVSVHSVSDDYSGGALTNPTVPSDLREVTAGPISVGRQ